MADKRICNYSPDIPEVCIVNGAFVQHEPPYDPQTLFSFLVIQEVCSHTGFETYLKRFEEDGISWDDIAGHCRCEIREDASILGDDMDDIVSLSISEVKDTHAFLADFLEYSDISGMLPVNVRVSRGILNRIAENMKTGSVSVGCFVTEEKPYIRGAFAEWVGGDADCFVNRVRRDINVEFKKKYRHFAHNKLEKLVRHEYEKIIR